MATVKRTLSTKSTPTGIVEIHLRISVSRGCIIRIKSGLYVDRKRFNDGKFIMPRDPVEKKQLRELEDKLESMEKFLIRLCEDTPQEKLNKDFVLNQLELFLNPPVEEAPVAPEVPSSTSSRTTSQRRISLNGESSICAFSNVR